MTSTKSAMQEFFRIVNRTPFNIAPEKGERLARDIFGNEGWTIEPGSGAANFLAIPSDAKLVLPYSGLASLWCTCYSAFHAMDLASRAQRQTEFSENSHIDIGKEYEELSISEYLSYAEGLFWEDKEWPSSFSIPNAKAALQSEEGKINNLFFGALSWILLHEIAHVYHSDSHLVPSNISMAQEYRAV